MPEVKYDAAGSAVMTKVIDELIGRFPGWAGEEVAFSSVDKDSGIAWYPVSGAIIEREKTTIMGEVQQRCQYPFYVLYRTGNVSEKVKMNIKEKLDMLGAWLERQEIALAGKSYRLEDYPSVGNRKIKSIKRTTPSYNAANYDSGICDWVVYVSVTYENSYFE